MFTRDKIEYNYCYNGFNGNCFDIVASNKTTGKNIVVNLVSSKQKAKEEVKSLQHRHNTRIYDINLDKIILNYSKDIEVIIRQEYQKVDVFYLHLEDGKITSKSKTFNLPLKATREWLIAKINTTINSVIQKSKDYTKLFGKLLALLENESVDDFPLTDVTTFGFSICAMFSSREKTEERASIITDILDLHNIIYMTQYSDAYWSYRIKISKSEKNINRIKTILELI